MKATGIVRRIDGRVIIRQSPGSRINTGFSLVLSIQKNGNLRGIWAESKGKRGAEPLWSQIGHCAYLAFVLMA